MNLRGMNEDYMSVSATLIAATVSHLTSYIP